MAFFHEKTEHSKLYKQTYWGGFTVENANYDTEEIIRSRNAFVNDNNIKAVKTCPSMLAHNKKTKLFDHCELYQTDDGDLIMVNSPYGHDDIASELEGLGFVEIAPLYHPNAKTFVNVFDSMKAVKAFANSTVH